MGRDVHSLTLSIQHWALDQLRSNVQTKKRPLAAGSNRHDELHPPPPPPHRYSHYHQPSVLLLSLSTIILAITIIEDEYHYQALLMNLTTLVPVQTVRRRSVFTPKRIASERHGVGMNPDDGMESQFTRI